MTAKFPAVKNAPEKHPGEILRCVVGSTLFGMSTDESDIDLMGVLIEPPERLIGLQSFDQHVWPKKAKGEKTKPGEVDCTVYGLRKFMGLAVGQNPTILTLFYVPPEFRTYDGILADDFRAIKDKVLSRNAAKTFLGYMQDQQERMLGLRGGHTTSRPELVEKYGFDCKFAGHYIRLGFQGIELLSTGTLTMPMAKEHCETVMAIRTGKWTQPEVIEYGQQLEAQLLKLKTSTDLRNQPDTKAVDRFLVEMYQTQWSTGY